MLLDVRAVPVEKRLRVRGYESLDEIRELLPAWEELLAKFPGATTFSTWEWLTSWWRVYANRQRLKILGFFDAQQNLIALAPICLTIHGVSRTLGIGILKLIGDGSGDSDTLDLPVLPGYETEFVGALLDYLEAHANYWDICQLNMMPDQSPAGNELLSQLRRRGWLHHVYHRPYASITLPDTWESYLRGLSSKEREQLSRQSRRLEKLYRVRFYKCNHEDELANCLEALYRLHEMRWALRGEPGQLRFMPRRRLYEEASRLFLARGWLELWLLDVDGKPAAAQFGLRYRDKVFWLQAGFDPAYSRASVGYVLTGHVIKQLIAAGVRRYDFGVGGGPDKTRWGAREGACLYVYFSQRNYRGTLAFGLMHSIKQTKEWLRPRVKGFAWQIVAWVRFRLRGY